MKPIYDHIIGQRYTVKPKYSRLPMKEVFPTRVYYDFPRVLPWEKRQGIPLKNKYVEFTFIHEGREITERFSYYAFFTKFERGA